MEPIFNKYRWEQVLDKMRSIQNSEFIQLKTDSFIPSANIYQVSTI